MSDIAIIDYGSGNVRNVQNALKTIGVDAPITYDADTIRAARALILPGVGAFGDSMDNVRGRGLDTLIAERIENKVPFLGICVGLQVLLESSQETDATRGLGLFAGTVDRFGDDLHVPHMGWNQLHFTERGKNCPIFTGIEDGAYFYFVHSYYANPSDAEVVAAMTDYGRSFASALWKDNLFAVQFHPEKSQDNGIRLLKNFVELTK